MHKKDLPMLSRISHKLADVIVDAPVGTAGVLLLSAIKIAADIIAPLMFVAFLDKIKDEETVDAIWYFAIYAGLQIATGLVPQLQEMILTPMGTNLGEILLEEAGEAFHLKPEDSANQEQGETYEIANVFGATSQPYAVAYSFLPVTVQTMTGLAEIFTINIYMWLKLGRTVFPATIQSGLYLLAYGPLSIYIANKFLAYINTLYQGFSHTIVFANDYIPDILFGQQHAALERLMNFTKNELNPKTRALLRAVVALIGANGGGINCV